MTAPTLQSLLSRVEAATGPNFAIEIDVARAFDEDFDAHLGALGNRAIANVTYSVDACIALANRVLPGWWWAIENFGGAHPNAGFFMARLCTVVMPEEYSLMETASHRTAPLAMITAILRAKIALAEQEPK